MGWVNPPPILEPILVGVGMFTGGTKVGFGPLPKRMVRGNAEETSSDGMAPCASVAQLPPRFQNDFQKPSICSGHEDCCMSLGSLRLSAKLPEGTFLDALGTWG